jgi:hypothetical protein
MDHRPVTRGVNEFPEPFDHPVRRGPQQRGDRIERQ